MCRRIFPSAVLAAIFLSVILSLLLLLNEPVQQQIIQALQCYVGHLVGVSCPSLGFDLRRLIHFQINMPWHLEDY